MCESFSYQTIGAKRNVSGVKLYTHTHTHTHTHIYTHTHTHTYIYKGLRRIERNKWPLHSTVSPGFALGSH